MKSQNPPKENGAKQNTQVLKNQHLTLFLHQSEAWRQVNRAHLLVISYFLKSFSNFFNMLSISLDRLTSFLSIQT